MKKVIFVGGTAYSGSTFFHLILANDQRGFACGEVASLFRPWKPHHRRLISDQKNATCYSLWKTVYENGERFLYETIFDLHPEIEFIVDSSKSPFWIQSQNTILDKKGILFRNILIWKSPLEFAHSAKKRGLKNWDVRWPNYHRKYFSLIRNWRAVKYHDLVKCTGVLKTVCQYLGISYFSGKEEFWNQESCILGGNKSARFHLQPREEAKTILTETFDENRMNLYRKIYYSAIDEQLEQMVTQKVRKSQHFRKVMNLLNQYDVTNSPTFIQQPNTKDAQFSLAMIQLRKLKYELYSILGSYKYSPE